MTKCRRYVWIVWISVGLTLVLSRCGPPEVQPAPPAAPPRTLAPPMPALPALRVGLAPQYPPIAFTQEGRVTGLEVDCAHGVASELGRQVTFIALDWDALIPALEAGQIDIIMSGMSITDARAQRVWFVSPYLQVGQMAIYRKGDDLLAASPTLLTMTRRRVGVVAGTTGAAYVHSHLPQAQVVPFASAEAGLQALRVGEIDIFVHDAVTAWRIGDPEAHETVTSSFAPLTEEYLAWAVRTTDTALHRDLEAVLERWRHSGHLQELLQKWLRFRVG